MDYPTIRDVAERAQVSVGSVSNFISKKKPLAPRTQDRIQQAINDLNWVPNTAVRMLHGHRSHAYGLIIPDTSNPFFTEVARGVEDVAVEDANVVVTCNTNGDPAREEHYSRALAEMRVAGVVITAMSASDADIRRLLTSGAVVVSLGDIHIDGVSTVTVDDELGGYLAATHALGSGRGRLAFMGGPGGELQLKDRLGGVRRALGEHPGATLTVVDAEGSTLSARMRAAEQMLALEPRPDAVICGNDMIALAVATACARAGVAIPHDVAIIGYDDIEGAELAAVPLTTVRQPMYELGRAAAELVRKGQGGAPPEHVRFVPELVVRASA